MKKDKKDLKEVSKKIEEAMETLEKGLDEKVMPKIKGMEMPILVAVVVMLLSAISLKMVIFGGIALAVLLSPKYMGKLMGEKKEEDSTVDKTEMKKEKKDDKLEETKEKK